MIVFFNQNFVKYQYFEYDSMNTIISISYFIISGKNMNHIWVNLEKSLS